MVKAEKALKWGIAIIVIFGILNAFYFLNLVTPLKVALPVICVFLVGAILLQSGKGGGLAAIGGLGDQAAFGTRTSTFLTKVTYLIGAAFIVTTIFLFKLSISNQVMNIGAMHEAPLSHQEHSHSHPVHEGEHEHGPDCDHDHDHAPHTTGGVDTASQVNLGMQAVREEKKQASDATETPMVEEQIKTDGNE
ncbi:MAG: preprotein translocase subunit SecG [wastewater metagenome]|nr:preprotein translocase subunit SecG [Candidatus Loosdrechtia aerotolerans]